MSKKKKIIIGIGSLIVIAAAIIGIVLFLNRGTEDAKKFKEEYESLNNTVRKSDGANYNNVDIPKNNPIEYVTAKEAVEIIKNKEGLIYFGANWCPWCRNSVPVLFEAAKEEKLKTIYYVDMDTIRNVWEIKDGKLEKTTQEGEGYYELLEALDSVLGEDTYTLKDKEGNVYDTKEKRIYMPLMIVVKDGKIVSYQNNAIKLNEDQTKYSKLTKEQHDELLKIYKDMISILKK